MRVRRVELLRRMKFLLGFVLALIAISGSAASPPEQSKSIYLQVILGTDRTCPQKTCREIGPKLSKKLSPVFRWKHFWEVDRRKLVLQPKKTTRVELAGDRKVEIVFARSDEVEVRLYRRNEEDTRDSFFIVVRPDEPALNE